MSPVAKRSAMSSLLRVDMFGGLHVRFRDETLVEFTPLSGALLAYLALQLRRNAHREEVIVVFWPDDDSEVARHKLRQALHSIRRSLARAGCDPDSVLRSTRTSVILNADVVSTDVAEFEAEVAAAKEAGLQDRIRHLSRATELYRGRLLPGLYQDSLVAECSRLEAIRLAVLDELIEACEQAGDLDRAIAAANQVVAAVPEVEEAHRNLMRLLVAKGQLAPAHRQYKELERILKDAMDATPSEETRELAAAIRQAGAPNGALPSQTAPFGAVGPLVSDSKRASPQGRAIRRPWIIVPAAAFVVGLAVMAFARHRGHPAPPASSESRSPRPDASKLPPDLNTEVWVRQYAPASDEKGTEATAITTDAGRNIYVAGFAETTKNDADFLTLKFDPNGKLLWRQRYSGPLYDIPSHDVDRARCIAVDDAGNVYVSGESDSGKGNGATRLSGLDIATIKYGPNGERSPTWPDIGYGVGVRRYNGPADGEDWPVQIALSDQGDLLVLGKSWERGEKGDDNGFGAVLLRYDKSGHETRLWHYYGGHGGDVPVGLTLSRHHNIDVALTSRGEPASGPETDFLTFRLDMQGHGIWSHRFGERNQTDDTVLAVGTDVYDNVYVVGRARGMAGTLEERQPGAVVVSYDPSGRLRWARGAISEIDRISDPRAASIRQSGAVLIFGPATSANDEGVIRAVLRNADGSLAWSKDYQGGGGADDAKIVIEGGLLFACANYSGGINSFRLLEDARHIDWVHGFRAADVGPVSGVTIQDRPYRLLVACQAALTPRTPRHITLVAYTP